MHSKNRIPLLFSLVYLILFFFVKDNPFFWDTIQLGSKHAHWYYENNFQFFFLPESIDSGHPPTFGMALAFLWKLFGKSLWVGHAFILCFSIGILFLVYKLGDFFLGEKAGSFLLVLLLVDPFVAGQSALVSPDVPLLFFWLLGIWAVVRDRKIVLSLAMIALASISMRGMMMVVVVFIFQVVFSYLESKKRLSFSSLWKQSLHYVPSGVLAIAFLWAHYQHAGWIGYHEDSPWAPSFAKVDFTGFLKNVAVLGWRILDYGRVMLWVCLLPLLFYFWKVKKSLSLKGKGLIALFVISFIILVPSLLLHAHLLAHRYLMPLTVVLHFIFLYFLFQSELATRWRNVLFALVCVTLLSGNLWVYPKKISQGWDATLGHLSYFPLREKMIAYIDHQKIPLEDIGTAYPENGTLRYMDLSDRTNTFGTASEADYEYVLYSNVMNDFSDEAIDDLENNYTVIKEMERLGLCMILYKKK